VEHGLVDERDGAQAEQDAGQESAAGPGGLGGGRCGHRVHVPATAGIRPPRRAACYRRILQF